MSIEVAVSDRVRKLREQVIGIDPEICVERAQLITQSYKENESLPAVLRRAKALEKILEGMSIRIEDGELIVGNQAIKPRAAPVFPEYSWDWLAAEIDDFGRRPSDRFIVSEPDKKELLALLEYWKGRTVKDRVLATQPPDVLLERRVGVLGWEGNVTAGQGHIVVDFEWALHKGLRGVMEEAARHLRSLRLSDPDDLRKKPFLEAVQVALGAVIRFAERFARLAEATAEREECPLRRQELLEIRDICNRVPGEPARTFREAIQAVWFIQLVLQIESNGHSISLGRFDQYMYPYYQRDLAQGLLTRKEALELIECLYIKLFSINKVRPWSHTRFVAGYATYQNIVVGGQTSDGCDATNEISHLCVEALAGMRLPEPNFYVRYHNNISREFLRKCVDVIKLGFGMPAFVNDKVIVPSLMNRGVSLHDAMNYCTMGCLEVQVPGKWGYRANGKSKFNLAKILELALNGGVDPRTGIQLCPGDGTLKDFRDFSEVMAAWRKQLEYFMELHVIADNTNDLAMEELAPDVFCSALVRDCIGRGKTIMEGGAVYDMMSGCQVGAITVGNSLQAIKEAVFEKGLVTTEDLWRALRENFESGGARKIRQMLVNRVKKYGNDDDEVDTLTKEAFDIYAYGIEKYKNTRYGRGPIGCIYMPSTVSISANVPAGSIVGATPDGRRAGEPVNDGISPVHGTEKNGPTAVVKSATKLSTLMMTGGQLLNMRFNGALLSSEENVSRFLALLRTFFDRYGWHVQFNMISSSVLKEAKKNPEEYRDLVIRVAGYSALFVALDPALQDDIISRVEYAL